jgi:HEAT repeat protein
MSSSDYEFMRDKLDEEFRNDPRSVEELLPLALAEMQRYDSVEYEPLDASAILQRRGSREVFEAARRLCESKDPKEQSLGATLLGQNLVSRKDFPDEKFEILFGLLENETDTEVLSSVCFALGHIRDPRAILHLIKHKNHPSNDVRLAVAHGLWTYEDEQAIATLIELSADEDTLVRDWATFGLGKMIDTNTTEIRDGLAKRLADEDENTRAEALVGLARRKDERILDVLIERLSADSVWSMSLEAAAEMEHIDLCPALLALKQRWQGDSDSHTELLDEAIVRCGCEVTMEDAQS